MANKIVDLSGRRFGRLTAVHKLDLRRHNRVVWHCLCDCGKSKQVPSGSLVAGNVSSCGCAQSVLNLKGQRFGRLVAVSKSYHRDRSRSVKWNCLCDCGKVSVVSSAALRKGTTRSCGCLQRERARDRLLTHGLSYTLEQARIYSANRRALKRLSVGRYTQDDVLGRIQAQRGLCVYCRNPLKKDMEVDHVVPLSKGGTNSAANIQVLCRSCNRQKFNRDPFTFALRAWSP